MATSQNMTPEEKARVHIDRMFAEAGWKVVDRDQYEANLHAAAIREGILKGNKEADYFLFVEGIAVGVLEAKKVTRRTAFFNYKYMCHSSIDLSNHQQSK